jgi:dienelactone hydrolase
MDDMRNPLEVDYVDASVVGFADPRSTNYNASEAEKGWQFIAAFLQRELSKPPKDPSLIEKVEDFFH